MYLYFPSCQSLYVEWSLLFWDVKCTFFCFYPTPQNSHLIILNFKQSITVVHSLTFLLCCLEINKNISFLKERAETPYALWWFHTVKLWLLDLTKQNLFSSSFRAKMIQIIIRFEIPAHHYMPDYPHFCVICYHYVKLCFSNIWQRWGRSCGHGTISSDHSSFMNFNFTLACFLRD